MNKHANQRTKMIAIVWHKDDIGVIEQFVFVQCIDDWLNKVIHRQQRSPSNSNAQQNVTRVKVKGSPILEMSVGFCSWSRSSAVSPQVTEAINQAVGWHYFPPGPRLPPQLPSITTHRLVPNYTAWWQRHMCVNNLSRVALGSTAAGIRTCDLLIVSPAHYPLGHRATPHV